MAKFGVGQPVPRTEDPRFLRGQGQYIDDMNLPGQVYGYVLRSPHAHARVTSIGTDAALASPGALLILTGADVEAEGIAGIPSFIPPMAFGALSVEPQREPHQRGEGYLNGADIRGGAAQQKQRERDHPADTSIPPLRSNRRSNRAI